MLRFFNLIFPFRLLLFNRSWFPEHRRIIEMRNHAKDSLTTSCEPRRSHLKKQNSVKISQLIPMMSTEVNNRLKTTSLIKNSCLLSQFRLPSK